MVDEQRAESISRLTDQQALSILDSLAGEFSADDAPEGKDAQADALATLFRQEGEPVNVSAASDAEATAAAQAARQVLHLLAEVPEVQPSLDEWLENPPTQETAAVPLVLAAPVVLAGCITVLHVAGHVRFQRHRDGTWELDYDPNKETSMDKMMKDIVQALAGTMRAMAGGG